MGPVFQEIHRSNLTKQWDEEPRVRKNEHGKVIKPPTYSVADIAAVLAQQVANVRMRGTQTSGV
jgi:hypothetical protein